LKLNHFHHHIYWQSQNSRILWNSVQFWSPMKSGSTRNFWNSLEFYEILWNSMVIYGILESVDSRNSIKYCNFAELYFFWKICAEQLKFSAEILWSKLPHFATKVGGNFDQKQPTIFRVLEIVFRTKSTHAPKLPCVYYLQA
jgi:hypothetical protein